MTTEPIWRRLLREPLLHFLALGAALFLIAPWSDGPDPGSRRIVVSPGKIENLAATFQATWQRPPTDAELHALIADHIREEVLYREAVALGLDRDDVVVRRRMRQKVELMTASLAELAEPTQADLEGWLRDHAERYRIEPRLTFQQIYLNAEKRGAGLPADAARILAVLKGGGGPADPSLLGDAIMIPPELRDEPLSSIAAQFGEDFAAALAALPTGQWSGPVASGYGAHLVRVQTRIEASQPTLDQVRDAVARDWENARTEAAKEAYFQSLLESYDVMIEPPGAPNGSAATAEPAR